MKIPFRDYHTLQILENFETQTLPLDLYLRFFFRKKKSIGAKDRREIAKAVYTLMRWRGLIDYIISKPATWEKRLAAFKEFDPLKFQDDETIPLYVRASFPKEYFDLLVTFYGEKKAHRLCLILNEEAPTFIRANPLKCTREELFEKLKGKCSLSFCQHAPFGLKIHEKINFFALEEFKSGLFEIQDEASQIASLLVAAKPKDRILDFCAGAGGKSLAYAFMLHGHGQIFLHDIREAILLQAKKRFKRAGIQNYQIIPPDELLAKIKPNSMDWVVLDVPCSGSGTLRRNPDAKWKFSKEDLAELIAKQRDIFEKALFFLSKKGKIAYMTCSIFPEENLKQVEFFCQKYNLKLFGESFFSFPEHKGKDGFFGAVMERNT